MIVFMGVFPSKMDPTANIFSYNLVKSFSELGHEVCLFGETPWWPRFMKSKHFSDPVIDEDGPFNKYRPRHLRLPGPGSMKYSAYSMFISYWSHLNRINEQVKIEGIYCFGLFPYLQLASFLGKKFNIPTVCSGLGWDINQAVTIPWLNTIAQKYIALNTIITVQSESNLKNLQDHGFQNSNIVVYKRGIDQAHLSAPQNSKENYRKTLNLPQNSQISLYAGRISRTKGVYDILNAHHIIQKSSPKNEHITIILGCKRGKSGDLSEILESIINEKKIRNVILVDALPREEVINYMRASDLFLFPSYHAEGMPNVVLEASSVSLPVIAADSAVIREFSHNGELVCIVKRENPGDLAEKIIETYRNYQIAVKKAEKAKYIVQKDYDIKKNIHQIVEIFKDTEMNN
jgi:teichuronic acid biosynthesis glycosyltransferase TuaC